MIKRLKSDDQILLMRPMDALFVGCDFMRCIFTGSLS